VTNPDHVRAPVIANRDSFAVKLGVPPNKVADFLKTVATFAGGATGTALASYFMWLASLGTVGQFLAGFGVIAAPAVLWPAAIGGTVLAGGVYGTNKLLGLYSSLTVIEGKRCFSSPLSDLGLAVAEAVFLPLTILVRADGESHPAEKQQVRDLMVEWGYDEAFVEDYLRLSLGEEVNASLDRFKQLLKEIRKGKDRKYLRDVCVRRMKKQVLQMGRQIMEADGVIDFREQILLEHYKKIL
jgi:tellurite resistance protein